MRSVMDIRLWVFWILSYSLHCCSSTSYKVVQYAIGQTALLNCVVEITGNIDVDWWYQPHNLRLTHNEQVETQDTRFTVRHPYLKEWTLAIKNIDRNDAGNYTCTCNVGLSTEISQTVELIVAIPPVITTKTDSDSYMLNSTVTLMCVAEGFPEPKITWHRIDEYKSIDLKSEGNTYIINSIDISMSGVYECHATNGILPIAMAVIKVDVLFAPIVRVPYREVVQEEGRWTQLSCLVIANPEANIYWIQNDKRINPRMTKDWGHNKVTVFHGVEQLSKSDFGTYRCYAENRYGSAEGQIVLTGQHNKKTVVVGVPHDTIALVGEDVLLNCSVMNLPKGEALVWWHKTVNETRKLFESHSITGKSKKVTVKNNTILVNAKYEIIGQYNLMIRKANFSDRGIYICQVTGHDNHSAILRVTDNQDPSAICQNQKYNLFFDTTTLFILPVVVLILLILVIVVIVLVYRLHFKQPEKGSVELSSKQPRLE